MLRLVLAAGLMLAVASPISAQLNGQKLPEYFSYLNSPTVQQELSLTADHLTKIREMQSHFTQALRSESKLSGLPPAERAKQFEEWKAKRAALADEYLPQLAALLDPEQSQRLQQIFWQALGSQVLLDSELIKQLSLKDEQTAKHDSVIRETTERLAATKPFSKEYMAVNQARDQSLLEILSDEQKELLVKLKGKKFDLSKIKIVRPQLNP